MEAHPISDLFKISMDHIKDMIDVNTVVGEMIKINQDISIIPISKVKCSFITGGTDQNKAARENSKYPFGGATGGMVSVNPVAFLVAVKDEVKLLHLEDQIHLYEKLIDQIPDAFYQLKEKIFPEKSPTVKELEVIEKKES